MSISVNKYSPLGVDFGMLSTFFGHCIHKRTCYFIFRVKVEKRAKKARMVLRDLR